MLTPDNPNKKHIAMYIGSLQKGGAERVMANLADFFFEEGYRVSLVTTYLASDEYEVKHAAWKRVPAGTPGATLVADHNEEPAWVDLEGGEKDGIKRVFSALLRSEQKGRLENFRLRKKKLSDIWKELDPDIILSFMGKNNIMALSTATKEGYKVVVSVRADPDMEYNTRALKASALATFGKAEGVIVQTSRAMNWFPGYIRKKCTILPNSMDPSFIRKRFTGEPEKKIVMVGRLDANKNQAMVMRVFADIVRDGRFSDYKLVLCGDGPDRESLQRLAISLGIDGSVELKGVVKNVAEHIENATLFILASDQEGMPNSLIEAMSLGLPCISTDCPAGGPADLINNGENGILIPVGDDVALKEAILRVLSDKAFADKLGNSAREVQETYSPQVTNKKWKDYIEGLL